MSDISKLSAKDRAKRYRQLAADARREAVETTGAVRESYLLIVAQFEHLALLADAEIIPGQP
jgi:hypothetical protein